MSSLLEGVPLVDHHCHGLVRGELDREEFEALLTEADGPGPLHRSLFDTQVGLAVRSICAPLLDLPRFASPADYLARRAELGADEVARRLLAVTGIAHYLVDTGYLPDLLTAPAELAAYTDASGHEIVRLEAVAEQIIGTVEPRDFANTVREALHARAQNAVGFKSIAAYRTGLDLDPTRPSDAEVEVAAANWLSAARKEAVVRLVDRTLIRFLTWTALDLGGPLQLHVGYGDADVNLRQCDPLLLTPLLRATAGLGVPVMLLHNYPFHRSAGYLAQVFDHAFVDVSLALHNVGLRASVIVAELLELAPFGSVLFSSDAFGLPELYAVSTTLFRQAVTAFFDDGVARGFWPVAEAERLAGMIASGNARRAYDLGDL
ncbi:MAG TPA: amidohydrolase [Jatrophihabitantaceae bacterium]|nr:amidohydrolase [Jatrophihabitantaceae bacterium]